MSEAIPGGKLEPDDLPNGMLKTISLQEQPFQHCNGEVLNTTGSKQEPDDKSKCDTNMQDVCCTNPESVTLYMKEEAGTDSKMVCSNNTENQMEVMDTAENTQISEFSSQDSNTPQNQEKEEANNILLAEDITLSDELVPKVAPCHVSGGDQLIRKHITPDDVEAINVVPNTGMTAEVLALPAQKPIDEDLSQKSQTEETMNAKRKSRRLSSTVSKVSTKTPPKNTINKEAGVDEKKKEGKGVHGPHSLTEKGPHEEKTRRKRNRKLWTKEEDETLVSLVKEYGTSKWNCISEKIKSRNRRQCRERWLTKFSVNWTMIKWTAEEDETLDEAYLRYGPNWKEIARLFPGRSSSAVMQHWRALPMKRKATDDQKEAPPSKKAFLSTAGTASSTSAPKAAGVEHILQARRDQQRARLQVGCVNETSNRVPEKLRKAVLEELLVLLPDQWVSRVSVDGAYALKWAPGIHCAVQQAVYASFDGSIFKVIVHSQVLKDDHKVYSHPVLKPRVQLTKTTVKDFAAVIMSALLTIKEYKLCQGISEPEFVEEAGKYPMLRLDEDLYDENVDETTMRVIGCDYLIAHRMKRCKHCLKYYVKIKRTLGRDRALGKTEENVVETMLSEEEVQRNLVAKLVETESLPVDKQLARGLEGSFTEAEGIVKLIWEEQNKANAAKKSPALKWHPLALRWALKKISTNAESRCIRVTPQRTLFEYFSGGINDEVVKRMAGEVGRFCDDFKQYVVVGFEEMCFFRNVVHHKTTGRIMGYVKLNEVDDEIADLEDALLEERVLGFTATSMLTYFVKGVAGEVRGVVACFQIEKALTEDELYTKTWDVIWELETAEVKVIALVGDGGALCHAFFNRHTAFSDPTSGVVYETQNTYSDGRPIFFFSDTRNLLKLIRNCFANSGAHKKTRLLMKKGEVITWKTIVDIFKAEGNKCPKLKGVHVFLNSHFISEVFLAAQVLSRSVAACIEQSAYPNTTETVRFIRFVNDFYDCLNGASEKPRNLNLAPYRIANDSRFFFLRKFLDYLEEWKVEIDAMAISEAEKQKRKLSTQTLVGIERTVNAFIAVVKFLLEKRSDTNGFILARTFQLDDGL